MSAADPATIDGLFAGTGPIAQGETRNLTVTGRGGVPATGVGAVALNVTAVVPTVGGFLTAWPAGAPRPDASNLNFTPGDVVPNMVIVKVGVGGQISLFNSAGHVDVVVDVLGWFPIDSSFTGLTPARLMETRPGLRTIDDLFNGTGALGQGSVRNLTVTGRGGVDSSHVDAVVLNVTAITPTTPGFLTVWPADKPKPNASNLNFAPGQVVPNMVVVPVSANGVISIFNASGVTDAVVDVLGFFPTGGSFTGLTPARLMETRNDPTLNTIDGLFRGAGSLGQGQIRPLTVSGRGGVPQSGAGAVALNVTAVGASVGGFLTVWPAGDPKPNASNLNFTAGKAVPNMVIVPIGVGGQISLFNFSGTTDVVVDVLGWFPSAGTFRGLTPARLMDTRGTAPPANIGAVRRQLVVRPALHQMAGDDQIAVWVCDVPSNSGPYSSDGPTRLTLDPSAIAAWAQANVTPYFDASSSRRYHPTFFGVGHIALSSTDTFESCRTKAMAQTGAPYTNVVAVDNTTRGGGYGSPGSIFTSDASNYNLFAQPPSVTSRGLWVGGGSVAADQLPSPRNLAHELGHTLHWPHSHFSTTNEYDNPSDLMSGWPANGWCSNGAFTVWPCAPQNTLAFNRFAAGWINDSQIGLQQSAGPNTFILDAPSGDGMQMAVAPASGNSMVMLTLEARPAVGLDANLSVSGVAAYIIDQREGACPSNAGAAALFHACMSTFRNQIPAIGSSGTYGNVLQLGTTTIIDGVTITVSARAGNTYTVVVSGIFVAPPL